MINHLDNLLRHLFISHIDEITEEGQVRFQPPDQEWRNYVGTLTGTALNVYLVDLRENRKLRSNERIREVQNNIVSETPAPRRIDCHYIITAWSPATPTPAVEPTVDESALLYKVTGVLMKHEALIPRQVYDPDPLPGSFPEAIADAELPLSVLPVEGFPKMAEFWGTVEGRWRPGVYIMVTLPVLMEKQPVGAVVTTRITEYRSGSETEIHIRIAGRVFEAANPENLIEGAEVRLSGREQPAITDARGVFSFTALQPGNYTLEVSKTGFNMQTKNITVPGSSVDAYDVGLSP